MDDNDNDIVFDRDTSAPKKKLKDKNCRDDIFY